MLLIIFWCYTFLILIVCDFVLSLMSACCGLLSSFINVFLLFILGAFDDEDVTHVEGDINPVRDLEIIHEELRLKDEQYLSKQLVSRHTIHCVCVHLNCSIYKIYLCGPLPSYKLSLACSWVVAMGILHAVTSKSMLLFCF